jgi:N-acetylmuramoyl-L-alanine amidase
MSAHLGLVLHVQEGNGGLQGWFSTTDASSTFWVSKTGRVEQYVDADLTAWAQGAGNSTYNSVETEGYTTEPLSEPQILALSELYRWGHEMYGWPYALSDTVGTRGFAWHGMGGAAWGGHVACPGDLRKAQRQTILALAAQKDDPDMPLTDADKKWITETVAKQVNDALRQQFRPEGECYGRVVSADADAIRRTPANIPK